MEAKHSTVNTSLDGILPPLSNRWLIGIIGLYIARNRTPNVDCYGGGGGST